MLQSGIPIQVAKEILGHAQLATTMIYTHVLDDIKQAAMQAVVVRLTEYRNL
jgi:site-specific recombinase XerD